MHFTPPPPHLIFLQARCVLFVFSHEVKSSILCALERTRGGHPCHGERLNTVIASFSFPKTQHSPSCWRLVSVHPKQPAERQTGNPSQMRSICFQPEPPASPGYTGYGIIRLYWTFYCIQHWTLIKLPHELKWLPLDCKHTLPRQCLKMKLKEDKLKHSCCTTIMSSGLFLSCSPLSANTMKPEQINGHIVHVFSFTPSDSYHWLPSSGLSSS